MWRIGRSGRSERSFGGFVVLDALHKFDTLVKPDVLWVVNDICSTQTILDFRTDVVQKYQMDQGNACD